MACENLVGLCFAGDVAPFGVHANEERAAFDYLVCCRANRMSWDQVAEQIKRYLETRNSTQEQIATQLELARPLFQPWLG